MKVFMRQTACRKCNINALRDNLLEEVSCLNADPQLPALLLIFVDDPHSACMANQTRHFLLIGDIIQTRNHISTMLGTFANKIRHLSKQNKDKPSSTKRESESHDLNMS